MKPHYTPGNPFGWPAKLFERWQERVAIKMDSHISEYIAEQQATKELWADGIKEGLVSEGE